MNGGHSITHNRHLSDCPGFDATRPDAPWNEFGELDLVCEHCGENRQFASEKEAYRECWEDLGRGWYCGECL